MEVRHKLPVYKLGQSGTQKSMPYLPRMATVITSRQGPGCGVQPGCRVRLWYIWQVTRQLRRGVGKDQWV
jgi:hypothetical protein